MKIHSEPRSDVLSYTNIKGLSCDVTSFIDMFEIYEKSNVRSAAVIMISYYQRRRSQMMYDVWT